MHIAAACVTVTCWLAITIVACREVLTMFASTENTAEPEPLPAPVVMWTHGKLVVAIHPLLKQLAGVTATAIVLPVLAVKGTLSVSGLTANEQFCAASGIARTKAATKSLIVNYGNVLRPASLQCFPASPQNLHRTRRVAMHADGLRLAFPRQPQCLRRGLSRIGNQRVWKFSRA